MMLLQLIAIVMMLASLVATLGHLSKRVGAFLRAYDDLLVLLVIINLLTTTLGVFVGAKVGYEAGGVAWAVVGLFAAIVLGMSGAACAEELID